jgi:hypothetical protein
MISAADPSPATCHAVQVDFTETAPDIARDIETLLQAERIDAFDASSQILGLYTSLYVSRPLSSVQSIILVFKPEMSPAALNCFTSILPIFAEDIVMAISRGANMLKIDHATAATRSYGRAVALGDVSRHQQMHLRAKAAERLKRSA